MGEKIVIAKYILPIRAIAQDVQPFECFTDYSSLQSIQNLDPITNEPFSPVIINDIENATHNRIEILAPRNRLTINMYIVLFITSIIIFVLVIGIYIHTL